jgi:hypothetical protein
MLIDYQLSQTSIILRVKIRQDTTGASPGKGKTGLSSTSSGLIISTIADVEATATAYTSAASHVQTISTLGTYAAPTSGDCGFREVDSTNHPGLYEIQLANARFAVSNAKSLLVSITGVSGIMDCDVCIPLRSVNPYDGVRGGMTAMPNVASGSAGAIITSGTGTAQLSVSSGVASADVTKWNSTNVAGSIPPDVTFIRSGTAQAGGASTITLDSGASATNNFYQNQVVLIRSGTGAGQSAIIVSYVGSTKVATINDTWATNPDSTSVFSILPFGAVTVGGYVSGQDAGSYVLSTPANKLATNASGDVTFNNTSIATVTNLTNLPSIPAGWLTATGIASSALNGKGDWLLASSYTTPPTTSAIASAVMSDVTDTVGADVAAIKTQTDKIGFTGTGPYTVNANASISGNVTVGGYAAGEDPGTYVLATPAQKLVTDASGHVTFANSSIATVTNLTNLPSIPTGWLTAAGIASGALDGKGDWLLSSSYVAPDNADISTIKTDVAALQTGVNVTEWNGTNVAGTIPPDVVFLHSGTAQGGGASTITLDSGASATNNFYQDAVVFIRSGTGAGQCALISTYVGATKVATINGTWATDPDSTSVFSLLPFGSISASVSGNVTVGGYAAGQDPGTYVLATPADKLATDASGHVTFANTSIATVTNLTNLPSIPSAWLTATGIAAGALDGKGDWLLSSSYTAPDNADIATIKTDVAALQTGVNVTQWNGANVGTIPPDAVFLHSGTAQGGGASTITLDAGASATNNFYQDAVVFIRSGTGAGQCALISSYVGSTKVATINGTWATNPNSTSVFSLLPFGSISASVSGNVTVGGYAAGQDPASYLLVTPANKLATDASGDVTFNNSTIATVTNLTNAPTSGDFTAAMKTSLNAATPASVGSVTATVNANVVSYAAGEDPATLVLDATASGHDTAGTIGQKINAAGGASDPLTNDVPGSYAAGTAGHALGNLDATVSSRLATSGYTTPPTTSAIASAVMSDVSDTVGADVVAIKAKTDNLPASPAAVGSQMDLVNAPNATAVTAIQNGLSKPGTAQTINLTTAIPPTGNTANTIADCLNAACAQGFGRWIMDPVAKTITLYTQDGTTVVRTFSLDSVTSPTQRI